MNLAINIVNLELFNEAEVDTVARALFAAARSGQENHADGHSLDELVPPTGIAYDKRVMYNEEAWRAAARIILRRL